jgi:hypothetical protein
MNRPWQILNGFRWVSSRVFQNLTIMHNRWILHEPYLGKLITGGFCWDNQIITNMSWKFPKNQVCDTLCVNEIFILQNTLALEYWKKVISSQHWSPQQLTKKYSQKTPNLEMVSLSTTTELNMIIAWTLYRATPCG